MFCLPDGTFQSADSLRQLFEPMLKKAGLLYDRTASGARSIPAATRIRRSACPVRELAAAVPVLAAAIAPLLTRGVLEQQG